MEVNMGAVERHKQLIEKIHEIEVEKKDIESEDPKLIEQLEKNIKDLEDQLEVER